MSDSYVVFVITRLVLIAGALVGFCFLNAWLAELARREWGENLKWFLAFFLLPIGSHVWFLIKYNSYKRLANRHQEILRDERKRDHFEVNRPEQAISPGNLDSVTPFDYIDKEDEDSEGESHSAELVDDEFRDPVVEELMNWGEYSKALDIIEARIEIADKKGNSAMKEAYITYQDYIRSRLNLI